jgi:3-oxoacyl-[acyl-carrier-protein] synthase-3
MTIRWPIRFCGTGMYVPEEVITNRHFEHYLDTSDDWIVTRTGIRERRRARPDESTSTMGAIAARCAIENAGLTVKDIDLIICATATGDHPFPAAATLIQAELKAVNTPAYDIGAACAGFVYGMVNAAAFIASGMFRHVLVVGAETLTRYADPEDRTTTVLFGDGAGAAVIGPAVRKDQGVLYCDIGCDGTRADHILVPAGGSRLYTSAATVAERLHFLRMKGREVFKFAVLKLQQLIDHALESASLTAADLRMLIPHQSNLRIIESARERLGLPAEKIAVNIDRFGNTSAASIIMSLDEARRRGDLKEGDVILLVAIGAGLTWSTMILRL